MRHARALLILPLVGMTLAGCLGGSPNAPDIDPERALSYVPLDEAVWDTSGSWSQTLLPGIYERLEPVVELVQGHEGVEIQIGIHRPIIPGCPTDDEANYPPECRTPVLVDSGPYYTPESIGQLSTRPPTSIWFVPHGYTVVHMAVRGTGGSGGCMEFMSLNEQEDVSAVVTDLANRAWSTGNVGMIGRSYDGTTPFMAAALGNPHLKTIVPISGVADVPELMFSNGTSEIRGPIMHNYVYWLTYGLGMEPTDTSTSQACEEVIKGTLAGAYTALTGDPALGGLDNYWADRTFRERILENYDGSLYIVHGMQDWNVNPRMVVPWINDLQDEGLKVKAWLGQWGHAYPDRPDEHPNVRWDWAETLLRWFDSELKGINIDTGPVVEVEDHRHQWWVMDSYPARDVEWNTFFLNGDNSMTGEPGASGTVPFARGDAITLTTDPIDGPARVSGLVRLPLKVTPTAPTGAVIYADLYDVYPDGRSAWLGHGWMNLRYHEGTTEQQVLMPGQSVVAKMEFEPLEGYLADGHRLQLRLTYDFDPERVLYGSDADGIPNPTGSPVLLEFDGESQLRVPLVYDFVPSPYAV